MMAHRPPNTRSGDRRQGQMVRNPSQFPQLFPPPRGGTNAPLISNLPQLPVFPPQMPTVPNRQRAPLLSTVPSQPFLHQPFLTPAQIQKMHQAQLPASLAASTYLQSVSTPTTLPHLRANLPQVTGPIIHPQAFPPTGIPNFQPGTINQQPPHFVPGGQPQPQVPSYSKPTQPMYPQATANHQGPPQPSLPRKPSKTFKIVNPDTGMEVAVTNATPSTTSVERGNISASSGTVEIDPLAENRKKEFMEKVTSTMGKPLANGSSLYRASAPNAIISSPQLAANSMNMGPINLQAETTAAVAEKPSTLADVGKITNMSDSMSQMSSHANAKEFTPSANYSAIAVSVAPAPPLADVPLADDSSAETIEKPREEVLFVPEDTVDAAADIVVIQPKAEEEEPKVEAADKTPVQSAPESPSQPEQDQVQAEPLLEAREEPEVVESKTEVVENKVEVVESKIMESKIEVVESKTKVVESKAESTADVPPVEPVPQPEPVPCATPSLSSGSSGSITSEERPSSVPAVDPEKPAIPPPAPIVEEPLPEATLPKLSVKHGQEELHSVAKQSDEIEPESSSSASEAGPSEVPLLPPPTARPEVHAADAHDLRALAPVPGEHQIEKRPTPLVKEAKVIVAPKEAEPDKKAAELPERTQSERAVRDRTKEERGGKKSPMSERAPAARRDLDRTQKQTKQEAREPPEQQQPSIPNHQKTEKPVKENLVVERRRQNKSPSEVQVEKNPIMNGEASDKERRQAYDREFLLQFRTKFLEPPPNLLTSEVCRIPMRDGPDMFAPPFSGGMSRKGGRGQSKSTKVINAPREEVQLNKAENRWVRPSERQKELSEEDKETIELFRKFQGILNKLTPQKFKDLAEQALALKINSDERLRGCIDKIFKKALEEPNFSVAYANLCRVMSQTKVEVVKVEDGKETQGHTTFRRELLTKCQREFEKDKKDDEEREKMLVAINEAETAEEKQAKKAELDVWQTKARSRSLGNIRFIGELFKLKMLSEGIMHECIYRLLRSGSDEESLECFCRLITTTGKELDHEQAKGRLDQYFDRIDEIRKKKKISSRIRFMLQDVLDLRKNGWVPRRQESLKTIDQIHYEAQLEKEKEKEMLRHVASVPPKGGRGRDMSDKGRGALKPQGGADEWRTKESAGRRDSKPDINRIQGILRRDRAKETAAGFRPQRWSLKPQGSSTPPMEAKGDRPPTKAPLRMGPQGVSNKRPVPSGTGRAPPAPMHRASSIPDASKERKAAIKLVAQMSHQPPAEAPPPQSVMDEALLERKTVAIIQELEQTRDFHEAVECVQEMNCPDMLTVFVNHAINHALELTSNLRKTVGKLFQLLIDEGVLTAEGFQAGCGEVLGVSEDLEVDIPKFWDYLAEMWSPAVYSNHLSLATLVQMVSEAGLGHKAAVCVLKILSVGLSVFGKDKTLDLWTQSLLPLRELGDDEGEIRELFTRHGLEFLLSRGAASGGIEDLPYLKDLSILFRAQDQSNDDILTWIEKNCSSQECSTPKFIHCLTQAAIGASTSGEGTSCIFTEEIFKNRLLLLKRHVDENELLQLEILYASQVAVTKLKHPPMVLHHIFTSLYDVEVVSESAFRAWKERGSEEFGRGVCLQASNAFFEWLGTTECESDAET